MFLATPRAAVSGPGCLVLVLSFARCLHKLTYQIINVQEWIWGLLQRGYIALY